jgi:4-hydroxybenzoyl-CoA reductase subunit alpha
VEIDLDPETGKYKLVDVATAHESGTVINPVGITGQLEGAIMMAGGYGYCEDQPMDNGKILNPSIGDYQLIRSLDMPDTDVLEIDTYEPEGPFGAKEAGEGLTNPTAAAISNAVLKVTGNVVRDLPITPEKVLKVLNKDFKDHKGKVVKKPK